MQALAQNVTVISARRRVGSQRTAAQVQKIRVAVYCRVSTDSEEQETSYEAQVSHYTEYIKSKPEWQMVEVYADDGISGTNTAKRDEFNRMIADCEAGKIDVLYTKSISRFSRNLADCISTVRRLRTLGIPVLFEEEGINTMNIPSELLFHILSIVAQEESNSIGQNMKWSIESRHANGIPTGKVTYGYRRENDTWRIEESEARRVRYAFDQAAHGASYQTIREGLDLMEKQEQTGVSWSKNRNRVPILLKTIAYTGDYITDRYFSAISESGHRYSKVNKGERDQYYLEDHHEGIVSRALFDRVQTMIQMGLLHSSGFKPTEERLSVLNDPLWQRPLAQAQ